MMRKHILTGILSLLFVFHSASLYAQTTPLQVEQTGTTLSASFQWVKSYKQRYDALPERAKTLPAKGTAIVEYDTKTLNFKRTLYYSSQRLRNVRPKVSAGGHYYSIEYSDRSKQVIRDDLSGAYDSIKDFAVIIDPDDATVIRQFENVAGLIWLTDTKVFVMQGVPTEACPDYHIDQMFIFNAGENKISEELDTNLFCGRHPKYEPPRLLFPCCGGSIGREYVVDTP